MYGYFDVYSVVVGVKIGSPMISQIKEFSSFSDAVRFAKESSLHWSRVNGIKYYNNLPAYYLLKVYTHYECTFSEDIYGELN